MAKKIVECSTDLAAAMQLVKDGRHEEFMKKLKKIPWNDLVKLDALYLKFGIKMIRPVKKHTCRCGQPVRFSDKVPRTEVFKGSLA